MTELKDFIGDLALGGRRFYSQLKEAERRYVVAAFIRKESHLFKGSILCDADRKTELSDLLADLLENRDYRALNLFVAKLDEIFIFGNDSHEAFYAPDIDDALENAINHFSTPSDFIDAKERVNLLRAVGEG